jgi:hypothetical protein
MSQAIDEAGVISQKAWDSLGRFKPSLRAHHLASASDPVLAQGENAARAINWRKYQEGLNAHADDTAG